MNSAQAGLLAPLPPLARHLFFRLDRDDALADALRRLASIADGEAAVVGLGAAAVRALGASLPQLRDFPSLSGPAVAIPATPHALWCWLRGDDRGELLHRARRIATALAPALALDLAIDAFTHAGGRDLSGYEDGTENPQGAEAEAAALLRDADSPLDGSSFVAVQQWLHDLDRFDAMSAQERDNVIGRRRSDNEELDDAPPSAHVKRTAQESFTPEAFILRRSMPWLEGVRAGLVFVACGHSFDAFEAQLRRMAGLEDGIADALFRFTHPISGGYFWCPGMRLGRLDWRAVKL